MQRDAKTKACSAATEAASGTAVIASSSRPTATEVVSNVEGTSDGAGEGSGMGFPVGSGMGFAEGWKLGRGLDGCGVGGTLGAGVGCRLGRGRGCGLGAGVGAQVAPEKHTPSQPRSELVAWPEDPPEQTPQSSTLQKREKQA